MRHFPHSPALCARRSARSLIVWLLFALVCVWPAWAPAQTAGSSDAEFRGELPDFMKNKPRIPDLLIKSKKEGSYFTAIPAIGVDPNSGFNYGVIVEWFDNGPKDSPFFTNAPYRKKLTTTVNLSTHGYTEYSLEYDQPYVADTAWRVRGFAGYLEDTFADYFGIGAQTLNDLTFPGQPGRSFSDFDEYRRQLDNVNNLQTWAYYNYYGKRDWLLSGSLERDFFGGLLRPLVGFQADYVMIHDYSGAGILGAENQPTRLKEDAQAGRIIGFNGGWDNLVRLGLTYDTRDYEPDPHSGMLVRGMLEGSVKPIGSISNYGHFTGSWRGYQRIFPDLARLVLVGAADYSVHFGDVPFFEYSSMSLPGNERMHGLGGWRNLRGYYAERFVGKVKMHAGAELRWTFADFTVWNQNLKPMLAPFIDAGRVFDSADTFTFRQWKPAGGIGFRLAWNLATLVSVDYGISGESSLLYVNLSTAF